MQNEFITRQYHIREPLIGSLETGFASLQRRAVKLDIKPPVFDILSRSKGKATVEVVGAPAIVNEHLLIAVLAHGEEAEEPVLRVADRTKLPLLERPGSPRCEFCHTERTTNDVFLVLLPGSPVVLKVGRACLQYLFPAVSPVEVSERVELLLDAFDLCGALESDESDDVKEVAFIGMRGYWRYTPRGVLALTAYVANKVGYLSKAQAEEKGVAPTVQQVRDLLQERSYRDLLPPSSWLTAETVIEWACEELEPFDDYEHSLKRLLALGSIEDKFIGYVVSAYQAFFRHREQAAKRQQWQQQNARSRHVGVVDKNTLVNFADLKVIFYKEVATEEYGISHLFKFVTPDGNVLCCFTRNKQIVETVKVGDTVHIRCKIKAHTEYEGTQQTELNYVSLISRDYATTGKKTAADKKPRGKKVAATAEASASGSELQGDARFESADAMANIPIDDEVGF